MSEEIVTHEGFVSQADHDTAVAAVQSQLNESTAQNQFIGPSGQLKEGWTGAMLGSEFKDHPFGEKFTSIPAMVKSHINLETMVGKNTVVVPTEQSTQDQIDQFNSVMGIPSESSGFKYDTPAEADLPPGVAFDEGRLGGFRTFAKEIGLNQSQFEKLVGFDLQAQGIDVKAFTDAQAAQQVSDKQELLGTIGEQGLLNAKKMSTFLSEKMSTEDNKIDLNANPVFANDPTVIKAMAEASKLIAEGKLPRLEEEMSLTTVQDEIDRITKDTNDREYKLYYAGDARTVEKVTRLYQLKNKRAGKAS